MSFSDVFFKKTFWKYRVYKKFEVILKAIILKTTQSNWMKLNSLGVGNH